MGQVLSMFEEEEVEEAIQVKEVVVEVETCAKNEELNSRVTNDSELVEEEIIDDLEDISMKKKYTFRDYVFSDRSGNSNDSSLGSYSVVSYNNNLDPKYRDLEIITPFKKVSPITPVSSSSSRSSVSSASTSCSSPRYTPTTTTTPTTKPNATTNRKDDVGYSTSPLTYSRSISSMSTASSQTLASYCNTQQQKPKGVSLDVFEPIKLLGKGSHGEVFLARHKETGENLAIKALTKMDVIRREQVQNTLTELRIHTELAKKRYPCPYIVPLRYAFQNDTHLFLAFDFLQGGELYHHLGLRGSIPEPLAQFYAAELCIALGYLHAVGVIYRDLKPENLCIDAKGHIYLVDFGLSKDGVFSCSSGSDSFCGTTEYLAPEILKFSGHGLAVDWWAFGMVVYEMLTGLPPWYSNDQDEVVDGILYGDLYFPSTMSSNAKDLISKLLIRDPKHRLGGKGGTREVMSHPFFNGIDWIQLAKQKVNPPFVPPSSATNLVQNFDNSFTSGKISCLLKTDVDKPSLTDANDNNNNIPSSSNGSKLDPLFQEFEFDFNDYMI